MAQMSGIFGGGEEQDSGSRYSSKLSRQTTGFDISAINTGGDKQDPRTLCGTADTFSGGIGSQSSRGYRQTTGRKRGSKKSRFDFGKIAKDVIVNSLLGGLTSVAFYGADRAVGAVREGIRGKRSNQKEIADGRVNNNFFDTEIDMALKKLDSSGLRPGQTEISKGKVKYIVDNYDPIKAQSSIYTDSTGQYLVEGHHTTVAKTILNKGTGMNMNQVSLLPPSSKNVYWTKKWYEPWKKTIKIKN